MVSSGKTTPDISVIITAGPEGRLAHGSVRSAEAATRHARARGIAVEFVAVLDAPSPQTLAYFESRGQTFDLLSRVEFGDWALARNHGVGVASGRRVAFLDAGTLFSENWLAAALEASDAGGNSDALVLHPELNLFFGRETYLTGSIDSDGGGYSPLELMEFNPWTASSFFPRAFFLRGHQYVAAKERGFGREDWHWNCETIAGGAVHRAVPGTVHFIRAQVGGPQEGGPREGVFRPSGLFDLPAGRGNQGRDPSPPEAMAPGVNGAQSQAGKGWAEGVTRRTTAQRLTGMLSGPVRLARAGAITFTARRPALRQLCLDVSRAARRFREARARAAPPHDWLVREWRRAHEVEPELFPSREAVEGLERRDPPRSAVARRYPELCEALGPSPTHVFLLPWVKRGGSDVEAILYVTAVLRENPGSEITCVITEDQESEWLSRLPQGVRVVEYGRMLRGFSEEEKAVLLLRLLLQKSPGVIHNINSALGYELFVRHGAALSARSRLFATIFGFEFMADGSLGGYAIWHLPHCIDYLSRTLTDSRYFADRLCDMFGFTREQFSVIYVPAPEVEEPRARNPGDRLNVLWASRFDVEKRLDVLLRVASELIDSPVHFHVYGAPVMQSAASNVIAELRSLPNVTAYGEYDGFASLPVQDYDAFLYTSERDGLPNVLLEAVAAGLPILAPDVGGIRELINEETGFLVSGAEAVGEYVDYVKRIQRDYRIVARKVAAARALVESRHSWQSFVAGLKELPGYLGAGDAAQPRVIIHRARSWK